MMKSGPLSDEPLQGRYLLQELVARGGMGEVFRAVVSGANGFEKQVAVKRILPTRSSRPEMIELFVNEAKLMTSLSHPNVVDVLDFGKAEDGSYFLVLEWIEGLDLGRFVAALQEPMQFDLAWAIAREMLRGLAYAHSRGRAQGGPLVHRDISPGNVLVSSVGEVKLADFGVASSAGDAKGVLVGKPGYMAPEQLQGGAVDERADLFAAGVVLFFMLTKRSPFRGDGAAERMQATLAGDVLLLDSLRPDAPASLATFFDRALAVDPSSRFQNAKEMSAALDSALKEVAIVASADSLASAVAQALESAPAARPAPIVLGRELGTVATRITHSATGSAFTVSYAAEPLPSTITGGLQELPPSPSPSLGPSASSEEALLPQAALPEVERSAQIPQTALPADAAPAPAGTRSLARPLAAIAVGLLSLGAAAVWLRPSSPAASQPSAAVAIRVESSLPPAASERAPASAVLSAVAPTGPTSSAKPTGTLPSRSASATLLRSASAAAPACSGSVIFAATHAWLISGGPQRVEAPGRYQWPCGSYGLTVTSRLDGSTRAAVAVIKEGQVSRVDLR
jgi:serine/threonine protein kinase